MPKAELTMHSSLIYSVLCPIKFKFPTKINAIALELTEIAQQKLKSNSPSTIIIDKENILTS